MDGIVYRTAKQSKADPTEFVLSDETVDRMGDVIMADGWDLKNFKNNPIALFNHRADAIVGKWENVRIVGKQLVGKLKFARRGTSELVDTVVTLFEDGFLKAVSVGFKPLKSEPLDKDADEDDWWAPQRYLQQELVECSIVAVPANPNALQISRSLPMPSDVAGQLFSGKLAANDQPVITRDGRQPPPARSPSLSQKGAKPMNLAQKIEAAEAERVRLKDLLTGLVGKDDTTEAEDEQIAELNGSIPKIEARIAMLKDAEKALAVQVVERDEGNAVVRTVEPQQQPRPFAIPAKKLEPLDFILRSAVVTGLAYHKKQPVEKILRDLYRGDEATAIILQKAAVNPAMTTVVGWAAELVQTVTEGFLDSLKPISVYARLRGLGLPLNFGAGLIKVPGRAATPLINGDFVGEGAPIPVRRLGTTGVTLTPKKVAVISTFTEEMSEYSAPQIEGLLREAITEDTAVVLDSRLLDANAATAIRPAGLRNGIAGLTPSAAADPTAAMVADFKALIAALTAINGGRKIAIIMNTAQSWGLSFAQTANGTFLFGSPSEASSKFGVTFIVSNTVPAGQVIAVDAADFVSVAGDAPNFDMSNQATIHEEDTTPLPINAGTPATPVRSLWQTDSIGLRMRMPVNWAMRRPNMVAWMEGVLW